jgi:hypothetical protein
VERDGGFVLDAEGAVEKSKVDEFRNNNVTLKKQLVELLGKNLVKRGADWNLTQQDIARIHDDA